MGEINTALPLLGGLDAVAPTSHEDASEVIEQVKHRIEHYEHHTEISFQLLATAAFYSEEDRVEDLILEAFKRAMTLRPTTAGNQLWVHLQLYPALWLLYGIGLACVAAGNYRLLKKLLYLPFRLSSEVPLKPAVTLFYRPAVFIDTKFVPDFNTRIAPVSDFLFDRMKAALSDFLPDQVEFDELFDWYEYLLALVYADCTVPSRTALAGQEAWGPIGRFIWTHEYRDPGVFAETKVTLPANIPDRVKLVLAAGMFSSDPHRFIGIKSAFDAHCSKVSIL